MARKDSTILYHDQMTIVRKWLDAEQIGRLMIALFEFEEGGDPEVADDIGMAFDFLTLQATIDRKKYEEKCETNRRNGAKGGAPKGNKNASKQPKQPNAKKNNPNDNDKTMTRKDNDNVNVNESQHTPILYGRFENVELTGQEYYTLKTEYDRTTELINKVSLWLRTHEHPDHFALCITFAENDNWPKRKVIEPAELPKVEDPLSEEEQAERMSKMKAQLGGMFEA